MTTINLPAEKIIAACDQAISHLNDMIFHNHNMADSGQQPRLGNGGIIKTYSELEKEYVEKRREFERIKSRASGGYSLDESEFNLVKRYL